MNLASLPDIKPICNNWLISTSPENCEQIEFWNANIKYILLWFRF
jgi:hypothetical protein